MTRYIALVSGKGGVGKTTTAVNLGYALSKLGREAVVIDANLGTPNVALQLGMINPPATLNQFLHKKKSLKEITFTHHSGVSFIPASPSFNEYRKTNPQKISEVLDHLDKTVEFVVIDAPSGLSYEVHSVLKNSDEVLLIVNPTLSSVTDALKTIQLSQAHNNTIAGVVLNMTHTWGKDQLSKQQVEEILGQQVIVKIKQDSKMRKALHLQTPLSHLYPRSRTAKEFNRLAEHLCFNVKN